MSRVLIGGTNACLHRVIDSYLKCLLPDTRRFTKYFQDSVSHQKHINELMSSNNRFRRVGQSLLHSMPATHAHRGRDRVQDWILDTYECESVR